MAKYLLFWNDEYRCMNIVAGPMQTDEEATNALKDKTVTRIVEIYGIDEEEARREVEEAYAGSGDGHLYTFRISNVASLIVYGDMREDMFEIVEY